MPFRTLTPELACEILAKLGTKLVADEVRVEAREERWIVHIPGNRVAWFAASLDGRRRLLTERRVLRLLQDHCAFLAPRVLAEDIDVEVRAMVPGVSNPQRTLAQLRGNPGLARQIGAEVGSILADQHSTVTASDVDSWLPRRPDWPKPVEWIRERLVRVVTESELIADAETVMTTYERLPIREADRALVHTDIGFHNMALDPASCRVLGIFDYEGAAWADRHHDFRYLIFDTGRFELLDSATASYERATHHSIERNRVFLYKRRVCDHLPCGPCRNRTGRTAGRQDAGRRLRLVAKRDCDGPQDSMRSKCPSRRRTSTDKQSRSASRYTT